MRTFGRFLLAVAGLLTIGPPAEAALSQAALDGVAVEASPNAPLPLALAFRDDSGARRTLGDALGHRPALMIFADYTCRTLCGPILDFAASGLDQTGLKAGADYRVVVIGLDPKDGPAEAQAMRSIHLGTDDAVSAATAMLIGDAAAVRAITGAAGYRYVYDSEHDQFAHPAAAYVITPQGRVARVLSGLGLDAVDLRLALVDAGQGQIGSFADRLRLLCYGFDPVQGVYTASVERWLAVCALLTVTLVGGWVSWMLCRASGKLAS